MPRPKYPSDHRRWFRVYEDILDDPKLASVELRDVGAFVVLLATLNRQKSRDGKAFVSWRSAAALLRCQKRADVERVLGRLGAARVLLYSGSETGAEYRMPKWSELQGFTPAELRRDSGGTPSPTPTPTPTVREEKKYESPTAEPVVERTRKRPQKSLAPDDLDTEQKVALRAWVRAKHPAQEPHLRELVDACLDYHRARGTPMTDWVAACRTWIRRDHTMGKSRSSPATRQDDRAQLLMENLHAATRLAAERQGHDKGSAGTRLVAGANVRQLRAGSEPVAD